MMNLRTTILSFTLSLGLGAGLMACGETEEVIDCADICNRYETCINEEYDEAACTSSCETKSDEVENFEAQVDACETCLDGDDSCAADAFACTDECASVVIASS